MTAVVDDEGTQDWVAGYNREGTTVANNAADSRMAIMVATVLEDSGGRQQQQGRTMMVTDDNGGG
jgi:hypothetical protein